MEACRDKPLVAVVLTDVPLCAVVGESGNENANVNRPYSDLKCQCRAFSLHILILFRLFK
jgi:hypothetical protein